MEPGKHLLAGEEETHGHYLYPQETFHRHDAGIADLESAVLYSEHLGNRGPIEVLVKDADLAAAHRQRHGHVRSHDALADAALATDHGYLVLDVGHGIAGLSHTPALVYLHPCGRAAIKKLLAALTATRATHVNVYGQDILLSVLIAQILLPNFYKLPALL